MRNGRLFIASFVMLGAMLAGLEMAEADTSFVARRMTRTDVPLGKGQCDIRLRVDGEVEVSVQHDRVHVRTITGRDAVDAGSECNEPMPARLLESFSFTVMDGRGEMKLLSPPDRQSGFRSVVRIRDGQGGVGRYHFRLSWQLDGGGLGRPGMGGPGGGPGPRGRDGGRFGDQGRGNDNPYPGAVPPPVSGEEGSYSSGDTPGYDPGERGRLRISVAEAVRVCTIAVRERISRDYRYADAEIQNARLDNRPGRNDSIIGDATGRRGSIVEEFLFTCLVNFDNGSVRSVDVRRR